MIACGLALAAGCALVTGLGVLELASLPYKILDDAWLEIGPTAARVDVGPRWRDGAGIGVTDPRRARLGLPLRVRAPDLGPTGVTPSWPLERLREWEVWSGPPAGGWDRSWTPVRLLLQAREGRALTAPGAGRWMWVGVAAGGAFAAWTFLLVAGCLRIWTAVLRSGRRGAGGPLLMVTAVAGGALAAVPHLMFHACFLQYLGHDARKLRAVLWEPWTMAQDILWWLRTPAAWSVLLGVVAIAVWLLTSLALAVAARSDSAYRALAGRFARVTLWSAAAVWLQYLVLSLIVEDWLSPEMLGGAWRGWA